MDDLIEVRDNLGKELEQTQDLDNRIAYLKGKINALELSLEDLSKKLHKNRNEASPRLSKQMEEIISKMGMQNARFKIDLVKSDEFLTNGKEQINFLFSANLGSDFKPIKKWRQEGRCQGLCCL